MRFAYSISPLGKASGRVRVSTRRTRTSTSATSAHATGWAGIRVAGLLSGHTSLDWPLGRFADRTGDGDLTVTPPAGVAVLPRTIPPSMLAAQAARHRPVGPLQQRSADPRRRAHRRRPALQALAGVDRRSRPRSWRRKRRSSPSRGSTAYGERSTIPVPRDQRRLAGERSRARRHHDGVRLADRRDRRSAAAASSTA